MGEHAYECRVTYQGYECLRAEYRRSDGLSPETGFVEIELGQLGGIDLDVPSIPWRAVGANEHDCGQDMYAYLNAGGTTTTTRPPFEEPSGGLKLYGPLVFSTYTYPGGELVDEITYHDVYVDAGIEETLPDLANIGEHGEGVVRVPLTDIRQYYSTHGVFFGRINCKHRDGGWDKDSTGGTSKPYSVTEVLGQLFSQLPGSPPIHSASEVRVMAIDPPQGIEGRGEPAVQHIQKVLDQLGLKAQMLPDGQFMVNAKHSKAYHRTLYSAPGNSIPVTLDELYTEKKTESATGRPSAVMVCGPKRIQRATVHCVPVLQDTDGLYYRLDAVAINHGYSLAKANLHIYADPQGQFRDVPPAPGPGGEIANLHEARRGIWKKAYKTYLPAFLFAHPYAGVSLREESLSGIPFLPWLPAAWYPNEIGKNFYGQYPNSLGSGDYEKFPQLLPPVVRGDRVGQVYHGDYNDMQKLYEAQKTRLQQELSYGQALINEFMRKGGEAARDILRSNLEIRQTVNGSTVEYYGASMPESAKGFDEDIQTAAQFVGTVIPASARDAGTTMGYYAQEMLKTYAKLGQDGPKELLAPIKAQLAGIETEWAKIKDAYEKKHGIPCRFNVGQTVLPPGMFTVDMKTGLITSEVPLCRVSHPVFFDGDMVEVVGDGGVVVTFGYEVPGSRINAFTNFVFFADDGGDPTKTAEIKFAGAHRSTPIKCQMIPMECREYIDEQGLPFNQNACLAEAKAKAAALLEQPAKVAGWTYQMIGLRSIVLDRATNTVQHIFDGATGVGMTHVAVAAAGNYMALLQANVLPQPKVYDARSRDALQRDIQSGAKGD